ncbi:MAG: ABC transporter ATP-binding protein [bacterium]
MANHLSKSYGPTRALKGFSLTMEPGETVGLIGLNGAGKSTFIKILLGFLRADSGSAQIRSRDPSDPLSRAGVGYLPEILSLPRNLSPHEFLMFSGRLSGILRPAGRIEQILTDVKLPTHAWRRPIRTLSKGQLQRVGLAHALLSGEELLILDEPASGLDPVGRRDVKDLLKAVQRRGKSVFLTSHILGEVEEICDRVCVIHEGQSRFDGATRDLLATVETGGLEAAFLRSIGALEEPGPEGLPSEA